MSGPARNTTPSTPSADTSVLAPPGLSSACSTTALVLPSCLKLPNLCINNVATLVAVMQVSIRKIGNSKGVIIPASVIEQLKIEATVELQVKDGVLLLKPVHAPRQGWFDHYDPELDDAPLEPMRDLESEQEDWEW